MKYYHGEIKNNKSKNNNQSNAFTLHESHRFKSLV